MVVQRKLFGDGDIGGCNGNAEEANNANLKDEDEAQRRATVVAAAAGPTNTAAAVMTGLRVDSAMT